MPPTPNTQIAYTYRALRRLLAVLAFALPLVLWGGGKIFAGLPLAASMSAYYHASEGNLDCQDKESPCTPAGGVMRDYFVGFLFAAGALLFAYQGYTNSENIALDFAGVFACLVAIFPMDWSRGTEGGFFSLHGTFAVLFFLFIGYVCIWHCVDTLPLIEDKKIRKRYQTTYQTLGWLMVVCPFAAWALTSLGVFRYNAVFIIEWVGIYVFAIYWVIKNRETKTYRADKKVAEGEFQPRARKFKEAFSDIEKSSVAE